MCWDVGGGEKRYGERCGGGMRVFRHAGRGGGRWGEVCLGVGGGEKRYGKVCWGVGGGERYGGV